MKQHKKLLGIRSKAAKSFKILTNHGHQKATKLFKIWRPVSPLYNSSACYSLICCQNACTAGERNLSMHAAEREGKHGGMVAAGKPACMAQWLHAIDLHMLYLKMCLDTL